MRDYPIGCRSQHWPVLERLFTRGALQDHHFQQALLNRLSLPRVAPESICAMAPQTGAHKGQLCGMPLDSFGRHSHDACRAADRRTRVHHAIRQCVANMCRKAGLNSEEEVVMPELHEKAHDGTLKEARVDVFASRLGGLERWMIDVRTVDGQSATAIALGGTEGAFRSPEQEKQRRYKGHAQALKVELCQFGTESSRTTVVAGSDCDAPGATVVSASWNWSWPSKQPRHRAPCTAPPPGRRSTPVCPV